MVNWLPSFNRKNLVFYVFLGLFVLAFLFSLYPLFFPIRNGMTSGITKTSNYTAPDGDTVELSGNGQMNSPSYTETNSSLQPYMSLWEGNLQEGMTSNRKKTSRVQYDTGSYIGPSGDTVYISGSNPMNSMSGTNSSSVQPVQPYVTTNTTQPMDENLYMLKSQIVPPVCPACPTVSACTRSDPPPCPPCARCPEPAFDCKKVPNYNSSDSSYLPIPVLSDFSSFGM